MSNPPSLSNDSLATSTDTETDRIARWDRLTSPVKQPLQLLSFWLAIALPFAHLSLLAQGIQSLDLMLLFLGLLALNVVALYVGHGYNQQ